MIEQTIKHKSKFVAFRCEEWLLERLKEIAAKQDRNLSNLMHKVLKDYVNKQ